jgi:hypothetical protein
LHEHLSLLCLTHVPRDTFSTYVATVHAVAAGLAAMDTVRRVRYALVDSDPALAGQVTADRPKLCYQWNRRMVEEANPLIAEVSYPSTGLGIETEIAASKKIPIIFIYRNYATNRAVPVSHVNPAGETQSTECRARQAGIRTSGLGSALLSSHLSIHYSCVKIHN